MHVSKKQTWIQFQSTHYTTNLPNLKPLNENENFFNQFRSSSWNINSEWQGKCQKMKKKKTNLKRKYWKKSWNCSQMNQEEETFSCFESFYASSVLVEKWVGACEWKLISRIFSLEGSCFIHFKCLLKDEKPEKRFHVLFKEFWSFSYVMSYLMPFQPQFLRFHQSLMFIIKEESESSICIKSGGSWGELSCFHFNSCFRRNNRTGF